MKLTVVCCSAGSMELVFLDFRICHGTYLFIWSRICEVDLKETSCNGNVLRCTYIVWLLVLVVIISVTQSSLGLDNFRIDVLDILLPTHKLVPITGPFRVLVSNPSFK